MSHRNVDRTAKERMKRYRQNRKSKANETALLLVAARDLAAVLRHNAGKPENAAGDPCKDSDALLLNAHAAHLLKRHTEAQRVAEYRRKRKEDANLGTTLRTDV